MGLPIKTSLRNSFASRFLSCILRGGISFHYLAGVISKLEAHFLAINFLGADLF